MSSTSEKSEPREHGPVSVKATPGRTEVFVLRGVSLLAAYGFWFLSRWLYEAAPIAPPLGTGLLVTAATLCALLLLLGAVAPDRLLQRIWKAIGKALVFLLMIS